MTLLERERQLERLGEMLNDASAGRGRLAVFSGEAGAGKTSLVREFLQMAPDVRVLRSFCEDLSVPDPLGPLYDLAREAQLPIARDPGRSQLSMFSDVLGMLHVGHLPTVVVIEDLHWADDSTLDFVRFLGRRVGDTHLLVLLTVRTEGRIGQRRLRRALVDVPSSNIARIDVPLLSLEGVTALALPAGLDGVEIHRATGGNPFFVTELAASVGNQEVPQSVTEAILERVEKLGPETRAAINLVSMFPRRVETELLMRILRDPRALDVAVDEGLLERSDVPIARLVHHAREANEPLAILELAPAAGAWAASVGSHHEAASHYRTALDLAPGDAALAHALAFEYSLTGRLEDAISIELAALSLHRDAGDRIREGDSLRWLSRFSYLAGRRQDTDRYGDAAVAVLEKEVPGTELAMAYSNHAQLDMLAERVTPTLEWGQKAFALAEQLSRADIVCATLNNVGNVQRWSDPDEARKCLARSLEMAIANNWHEHAARAYANWGCMDIELLQFELAEKRLAAGIAYCAERDLDTLRLYMMGWMSQLRLKQGQWSLAAEIAAQVLDSDLATPLARFQAADVVARLRIRRGDPGDEAPLAELTTVLSQGREFQRLAPYATLMAERAWITGADVQQALLLIDEAASLVSGPTATRDLAFWRSVLTNSGTDWAAIAADRRAASMPFEQALALLMDGRGAEKSAMVTFEQLGAAGVIVRARHVLSSRGLRGPRRTTLSNEGGLTNRELDVLKLLIDGLSNKAIAMAMHVSPKTIDHHVSAILGKLGVDSRGHAAAMARHRGLV